MKNFLWKFFDVKQLQIANLDHKNFNISHYYSLFFICIIRYFLQDRIEFEGTWDVFIVFKNQFFLEKTGSLAKPVNIVVILDSLKILKRYIDIFKKKLSLIYFYSPF